MATQRQALEGHVHSTIVDRLGDGETKELLANLGRVVLTNSAALTGARRRRWSWSRGRKARHSEVAGLYHQEWRGQPAWIEVFVDKALTDAPRWALRVPVVRKGLLGSVLYHEVGHHLHNTHRPAHREREMVAEQWASHLLRSHMRQRHPLAGVLLSVVGRTVGAGRTFARKIRTARMRVRA